MATSKKEKSSTGTAWKKKLKAMQKKWKDAVGESKELGGFQRLEDGRYIAKLTDMIVGESESGRVQLVTTFGVVKGDSAGETFKKFDGLEREEGLKYIAKDLMMLGVEQLEDLDLVDELPDICKQLVKAAPYVRVRLRTNDEDYQNCYLEKVLADVSEDEPAKKKGGKKKEKASDDFSGSDSGSKSDSESGSSSDSESASGSESGSESKSESGSSSVSVDDTPTVGAACKVMVGEREKKGKVISVDDEKKTAMVKLASGSKKKFEFDDIEILAEADNDSKD